MCTGAGFRTHDRRRNMHIISDIPRGTRDDILRAPLSSRVPLSSVFITLSVALSKRARQAATRSRTPTTRGRASPNDVPECLI